MRKLVLGAVLLSLASAAHAQWAYSGGEGQYHAYVTDGGFVDDSHANSIFFVCYDSPQPCELSVKVDDQRSDIRDVVTFDFPNHGRIERLAEPGGIKTVVGWEKEGPLIKALLAETSVTVTLANGASHTFSLRGSSKAIARAMNNEYGW